MTCTDACRAMVYCTTCRKRKAPIGRSVPLGAEDGYCMLDDCPGYQQDPPPPHLWPSECVACWNIFMSGGRGDCEACRAREEADQ